MDRGQGFFVSGGTLPPGSESYLERSADKILLESLLAGRFCYVLNSRQSGKSSLSVRAIGRLEEKGIRTAFLDLTRIGGKNVSPEQWYSGLALGIARDLGLRREVMTYWKEQTLSSPVQRLFDMLLDVALADAAPLVIFIDEIDATRSLSFDADEFFAGIRECFNRRVSEPAFEKLTFCLLGVAVPSDLVRNRATTPFNVGERIILEDFTVEELTAFAPRLGPNGKEIIARVHYWSGGHPYLSQSLCRTLANRPDLNDPKQVDEVVGRELFDFKVRDSNINLADVANIALHYDDGDANHEALRADTLSVYQKILAGRKVVDDESNRAVVVLKLSGIVRPNGRRLYVRNRIYENVFDQQWVRENMPGQELQRQQQSYRRGVLRTALVSGSMLVVVLSVAALAWYSRVQTLKAEERLDYELYVADITSMRQFFETGDTRRIEAVLERHRNSPYRGFEWSYWLGRYHDSLEEYTLDYNAPGKRLEGHISTDGRQICIVDLFSRTGTIVDRTSKRVMTRSRISVPAYVVALRSRWAEVVEDPAYYYKVVDLQSGKDLSKIGNPNRRTYWILPLEHCDFVGAVQADEERKVATIGFWNAETGKKVFEIADPWQDLTTANTPWKAVDLFSISKDGRYVLYPRSPVPGIQAKHSQEKGEAVLLDLHTQKIVDRFPVDKDTYLGSRTIDGGLIFLYTRTRAYVRDFRNHQSIETPLDNAGNWRINGGTFAGNSLIALLDGGRCIVRDVSGLRPDAIRGNTFSVAPGFTDSQYLCSSSSVRLYDTHSPTVGEVVADGRRVTRYSSHVLNFFASGGQGIVRADEKTFHPVGSTPSLGDNGYYTYSGRWSMLPSSDENHASLQDAEGKLPPIPLPTAPVNWSCGQGADSIVLLDRRQTLQAYDGIRQTTRWKRSDLASIKALWVSPSGTRLFVGTDDPFLTVLDMASGHTLGRLESHNLGPLFLTFSANGQRAFTCGGDGRAVMWDTNSLKKLIEFRGNDQEGITSADLSPDGRRVVTTSRAGSWQLWDTSTGVQLMDVRVSAASLSSAIFASDGKRIVTAGDDEKIRVWGTVDSNPTTYVPFDQTYLRNLHL